MQIDIPDRLLNIIGAVFSRVEVNGIPLNLTDVMQLQQAIVAAREKQQKQIQEQHQQQTQHQQQKQQKQQQQKPHHQHQPQQQ